MECGEKSLTYVVEVFAVYYENVAVRCCAGRCPSHEKTKTCTGTSSTVEWCECSRSTLVDIGFRAVEYSTCAI